MLKASALGVLLAVGAILPQTAWSIPAFARKEGGTCAMCHTVIPRLNEYGYKYRKAGYRDPGYISTELDNFSYADVFSARLQARYDVKHRDKGGGQTTTSNQLSLHEVTLYPLSGSFGKYYGSLLELSVANEDFFEIENAYFRFTWGNENAWFSARLGIFHPFEDMAPRIVHSRSAARFSSVRRRTTAPAPRSSHCGDSMRPAPSWHT